MKNNKKGIFKQIPKKLTVGAVSAVMAITPMANNMLMVVHANEAPEAYANGNNDYVLVARDNLKPLNSLDFTKNGDAQNVSLTSDMIMLTKKNYNSAGSLYYNKPLDATKGFSAAFQIEVGNKDQKVDGFTFVISDSNRLLGNSGPSLGYAGQGGQNSMAIEFDLYSNTNGNSPINTYGNNPIPHVALNRAGQLSSDYYSEYDIREVAPGLTEADENGKFNVWCWVEYNHEKKEITYTVSPTRNRNHRDAQKFVFKANLGQFNTNDVYLGLAGSSWNGANSPIESYIGVSSFYADNSYRKQGIAMNGNAVEDNEAPTKPIIDMARGSASTAGKEFAYYNVGGSTDNSNGEITYMYKNHGDIIGSWTEVPELMKYDPEHDIDFIAIDRVGNRSRITEYKRPVINVTNGTLDYVKKTAESLAPGLDAKLTANVPENASFVKWNVSGDNELLQIDTTKKNIQFKMPLTGNFDVSAINKYNTPTAEQLPSGANLVVGEYGIRLENAGLHKGWKYALMHEGEIVSRWITANGTEAITFGGSADERGRNDLSFDTDYQIAVKVPGDDKAEESDVATFDVRTAPGKIEAKKVIDKMITSVKNSVNELTNLTQAQHDQYFAEFDAAATEIKTAIDAGTTQEAVDTAKDNGITKLTQMLDFMRGVNDKNLTDARTNALKAIYDAKDNAIKDINKLSNLTFEEKSTYKNALNTLYDDAKIDINGNIIVKDIEAHRDTWLNEITTKLTAAKNADASAFAKYKDAVTKEINDEAAAAKTAIDGLLNISQDDKTKAKVKVQSSVAAGLSVIKNSNSEFAITAAKIATIAAIDSTLSAVKADDARILADAKTKAVTDMNKAASYAVTSIEALKNLDAAIVTNAKAAVQKALDDGIANVNSAATNTTVIVSQFVKAANDSIASTTNTAVNQDKTNLADAKAVSKDTLETYLEAQINLITALDNLSDKEEKDAKADVTSTINTALTSIDTAVSKVDINKIVKDAKTDVENILHDIKGIDDANLITNKDDAKKDIAKAVSEAKTTIGELSNITSVKLKEAMTALDEAAKTANEDINAAAKTYLVTSAKNAGLIAIENIVNTYKVTDADNIQSWKQFTNAGLTLNAEAANTAIDALKNLTDVEKQTAKDAVVAKLNEGTVKVNAATDLATILSYKTTYENAINGIRVNALDLDAKHLQDAKTKFNTELDKKAADVRKAILDLNNLTNYEKRVYTSRVATIVEDAKDAMADLDIVTDVNALLTTTIKSLATLQLEAEKENNNFLSRAKANANADITKEEITANKTIRSLVNLTSIEMNEALKAVRSAAENGQKKVGNAKSVYSVNEARDDAIAAINKVTANTKALDAANLKNIKDHNTTSLEAQRESAKADIDDLVNLTAIEARAAKAAIDANVDAGVKAIEDSKTRVEAAEASIKTKAESDSIIKDYKAIDTKNLAAAKEAAYDDANDAEEQAKAKIDALRNILAIDKLDFNKAIDNVITANLNHIKESTSITDVKATVKAIISDVNKVAADAKALDLANLNKAKQASLDVLNNKANEIKAAIDAMVNLSQLEKNAAKTNVDMIVKSGTDKINAKDIIVDVDITQTASEEDLANVLVGAEDLAIENLAQAKEEAKKEIAETSDAVKKAINELAYLTQEQKKAYKAQVDGIIKDYVALIEAMETVQAVTDYKDGVIKQLGNVKAEAMKANEDAKPKDKAESNANSNTVATGDTTNTMGSLALIGAALTTVFALNKKRRNLK